MKHQRSIISISNLIEFQIKIIGENFPVKLTMNKCWGKKCMVITKMNY